jgi:hypothetical protein
MHGIATRSLAFATAFQYHRSTTKIRDFEKKKKNKKKKKKKKNLLE